MVDLGNVLHGVGGSAGDISLPAILGFFVQEAGVPLPLPISAVLLLIGYQEGSHPLLVLGVTTLLLEVASVLGTRVKYWFGLKGGRPFLYTYGRYVRLKADRLERSEQQFRERGTRAVIVGRLVPGVSMVTPLAAGALGMPYRRFLPAVAAGSAINIVVLVMAGFWAGPAVIGGLVQVGLSVRALATLGLLLAVSGTLLLLRRHRVRQGTLPLARGRYSGPFERALTAGLLAMFGMGIGVNLVLYAMTALGLLEPQEALVRFVELTARLAGSGSAALAVLIVLFVVGGAIWSVLYTLVAVRLLPGPPGRPGAHLHRPSPGGFDGPAVEPRLRLSGPGTGGGTDAAGGGGHPLCPVRSRLGNSGGHGAACRRGGGGASGPRGRARLALSDSQPAGSRFAPTGCDGDRAVAGRTVNSQGMDEQIG